MNRTRSAEKNKIYEYSTFISGAFVSASLTGFEINPSE
jgi:hypothetical protein